MGHSARARLGIGWDSLLDASPDEKQAARKLSAINKKRCPAMIRHFSPTKYAKLLDTSHLGLPVTAAKMMR